jgi:hypothetical protein
MQEVVSYLEGDLEQSRVSLSHGQLGEGGDHPLDSWGVMEEGYVERGVGRARE